jgi:hypothetical protein
MVARIIQEFKKGFVKIKNFENKFQGKVCKKMKTFIEFMMQFEQHDAS